MADKFKWSHPTEWLNDKINGYEVLQFHELRDLALAMASKLDGDEIQDLFEPAMNDDGYFDETLEYRADKFVKGLNRATCAKVLMELGIEVYDHEEVDTLRAAVAANILDETTTIEDAQDSIDLWE